MDPYVGVLSDPTSYVYTADERIKQLQQRGGLGEGVGVRTCVGFMGDLICAHEQRIHTYMHMRDLVEHLVEDVLDFCARTFHAEMKVCMCMCMCMCT